MKKIDLKTITNEASMAMDAMGEYKTLGLETSVIIRCPSEIFEEINAELNANPIVGVSVRKDYKIILADYKNVWLEKCIDFRLDVKHIGIHVKA